MKRGTRTFDTAAEAAAFVAGVEWVNDSAAEAEVDDQDPRTVQLTDHDASEASDDD